MQHYNRNQKGEEENWGSLPVSSKRVKGDDNTKIKEFVEKGFDVLIHVLFGGTSPKSAKHWNPANIPLFENKL